MHLTPVSRRVLISSVALALAMSAALASFPTASAGSVRPALTGAEKQVADIVCDLPEEWLLRTYRGHMEGLSGEIQLLVNEPDYIGSGLPHVGPWDYVQDIPMFWYGPGHVAPNGHMKRPVTLAEIAPTTAEMIDFPFQAPDGEALDEVLVEGADPPKLILTMVWDAAGMNVLNDHPDDWPFLASLIEDGTWFDNASVGTTPTSTAQTHAVIGTGAYPRTHGIVGHRLRVAGEITTPWRDGPIFLLEPTLADLYDHGTNNEPVVGELGTVEIHLGMLGHGAMYGGGDKDVAVIREALDAETLGEEGFEWNLTPRLTPYFKFPKYINDVPGFDEDVKAVDAADGRQDGKWRSNEMLPLLAGFDTPARIPYQTRVLEAMIEGEGFGKDEVPDLLFANFKMIDYISHVWTVNSLEMKDAVRGQDASLRELVGFLDQTVGEGEWALVLTADHGSIPDPDLTGAVSLSPSAVATAINQRFDTDGDGRAIVELVQSTHAFVNEDELAENGATLAEISLFLMTLTKGQLAGTEQPVPPEMTGDLAFEAAFPSTILSEVPCLEGSPEIGAG